MRRRLHILLLMATAVVGVGLTVRAARADERPVDMPPASPAAPPSADPAPPAELPDDFLKPSTPPANLGPEPTPYTAEDAPATPKAAPKAKTDGVSTIPLPTPSKLKNLFKGIAKPAQPPAPAAAASQPVPVAVDPLDAPPPEVEPAAALPAPPKVAPPPSVALPAPSDVDVERVQAGTPVPAKGNAAAAGPLPPAAELPGQPAPTSGPGVLPKDPETPFVIAPDKLPVGRQGVGLTVEVIAPQFLNVNQTAPLKIVVKNTGTTDARGVVVRDVLPPNLKYESSQPEAVPKGDVLIWHLGDVPAGSERLITLTVTPTATGGFEHAATVTMAAGAKSRTVVRAPQLKVELAATSGKILRGQPVTFRIAITNPGDGPARSVSVKAKLSPGLRHESGEPNEQNLYEQTLAVIAAGETITLDSLVADTILGGDQSCSVVAKSPDVVAGAPSAVNEAKVVVIEPKLTVKVAGPKERFTDTLGAYEVVLENPGTAAARNVKVVATVPVTARLQNPLPTGSHFNPQTRKLTWSRAQIDAGEKVVLPFTVRLGGSGLYTLSAEAKADTVALSKDVFQTDVSGLAVVDFEVTEGRHVVDVDGTTTFVIKIDNKGTKEANNLLVAAEVSPNVEVLTTGGTDEPAKSPPTDLRKLVFPAIPRLGANKSLELGIKVKALGPDRGIATCRVYLTHDEGEKLDEVTSFKIVPSRR
jgi:uncharacterized repeat protein (TIGR01451 family)